MDEWNPSTVDLKTAYKYKDGFESLVNYCYDGLYYFYGKIDGIGAMEMGTDLWDSEGKEVGFTRYDSNMNTNMGTLKVLWNGFYATINYWIKTNPNILNFDNAKHQIRPIPQSYLDAIANAAEFGNNGY